MTASIDTFGGQLRHFARSVDIVDDHVFDSVRKLIYKYVRNELGAAYFELTREELVDTDQFLKMFWSTEDNIHTWRVRQADGSYTNVVTQAFGLAQPLWVVGEDGKPLTETSRLEDQWSRARDLPPYKPVSNQPVRTVVAIPLKFRRLLGVLFFESSEHIGITEVAKTELLLLAEAVTVLLELWELNRTQSSLTSNAISDLQDRVELARFPKLTMPHFFVAYSNRADPKVTTVVNEVLRSFAGRLEYTDWNEMSEAGEITSQIVKEISRSRFGVCYFSEPNQQPEQAGPKYVDNFNVVFEAGMLNAHTAPADTRERKQAGWIPMREKDSPSAPFDLAGQRMIQIPRYEDGGLNEGRLRDQLQERVRTLLESQ